MLKRKPMGMQADASVRIAAGSAIFEVASYGASHLCQLASNLMMAACAEMHLKEIIAVGLAQQLVVQDRLLASGHLAVIGFRLVAFRVAGEPMRQGAFRMGRRRGRKRQIGLPHPVVLGKKLVHAAQSLAGAGKTDDATNGAVQAVDHANEHLSGFLVLLLDI